MILTEITPGIHINLEQIRGVTINQTTGAVTVIFDATQTYAVPAAMRSQVLASLGLAPPPAPPGATVIGTPQGGTIGP